MHQTQVRAKVPNNSLHSVFDGDSAFRRAQTKTDESASLGADQETLTEAWVHIALNALKH